ncbi:MAG TPA: efflux RND transporter periplasmic adaptor subunit [Burkholderiales bacterium]|nr:efflux RND transporter periplasmic adaptor subunit [Burkholderiales bacterium]
MPKSNFRVVLLSAIGVALGLGALFGYKGLQERSAHAAQAHPGAFAVSASAAPVRSVSWQRRIDAVASLVALQSVHLTPQLPGQVTALYFHSGQHVDKGERLLQLDDSTQLAQLASDQAAVELAQTRYARAQRLFATHAASEADVQSAHANLQTALAAVTGDRATLAKLALSAPFSGWLGVREVSLGQYLNPGSGIATLTVWDPVRVQFTVPQSEIGAIEIGQAVSLTVDAFPGKTFEAKVSALGSEVDPSSRNVTVEAMLPNPQHLLRPGMFAQAQLLVGAPQQVLAVPTVAITYNTYGDFVYRVETHDGNQVAVAAPVRTGESRDGLTQVLSGLKSGEQVVTAGQLKLHDGAAVKLEPGGGN